MPLRIVLDQIHCNCEYCFCPNKSDKEAGYYCNPCFNYGHHPGPLKPGGIDTTGTDYVKAKISTSIIKRDD